MLLKYDGIGKVDETPRQVWVSPLGVIYSYQIGGDVFFEIPEMFGVLRDKLVNEEIPRILKLMGKPCTLTADTRSTKHGNGNRTGR